LGDLGIYIVKIHVENLQKAYETLKQNNVEILSDIVERPNKEKHFYVKDPYGNIFEIEQGNQWNLDLKKNFGGSSGCLY